MHRWFTAEPESLAITGRVARSARLPYSVLKDGMNGTADRTTPPR